MNNNNNNNNNFNFTLDLRNKNYSSSSSSSSSSSYSSSSKNRNYRSEDYYSSSSINTSLKPCSDDEENYCEQINNNSNKTEREIELERIRIDEIADDNRELEMYITTIEKINIPNTRPWYGPLSFPHYKKYLMYIKNICEMLGTTDNNTMNYDGEPVFKFYRMVYSTMILNLRACIKTLPGSEDKFSLSPLYNMYIACSVGFEYLYRKGNLNILLFSQSIRNNEYCKKYKLITSQGLISSYNVEKLLTSVRQLEFFWRTLPITDVLIDYIRALELRSAQLLIYGYDESIHNVKNYRIPIGKIKNTNRIEYYCTKEMIFELALRFVSLHEELTGSLMKYRKKVPIELKSFIPTKNQINSTLNLLIIEVKKVHSDSFPDSIRRAYQMLSIKPSENYMFFKQNQTAQNPEPDKIIELYRNPGEWEGICNRAGKDPAKILEDCDDPLGVRLCFFKLMDIICLQDINKSWSEFSTSYYGLINLTETKIKTMQIESLKYPRYVISVNCAGVFYNKNLYTFGAKCKSYIKALLFWLNIIVKKFDGFVRGCRVNKLYKTLTGGLLHKNVEEIILTSMPDDISSSINTALSLSRLNNPNISSNNNNDDDWGDFLN